MPRRDQLLPEPAISRGWDSFLAEQPDDVDARPDDVDFDVDGLAEAGIEIEGYDGDFEEELPEAFDDNLAEKLDQSEQCRLGQRLWEYVQVDLDSRSTWETRMLDGLEVIGLQDLPADATAFVGAAQATYPGIAEGMIQFNARAMEELMPPEGPVKCGVLGDSNPQLEERSRRVENYMNYQLMEEDDEYYNEVDDGLLYLPYAGSAFRKIAPDPITNRTRSRFVPAIDFIVPYWAKSLATAPRYTHRYTMSYNDFRRAVANGYFVDVDFPQGTQTLDTDRRALSDTSDDRTVSTHEDDDILEFYEVTCEEEFEWETQGPKGKYKLPYTITFERDTQRVVRIARCWDELDPDARKDVWFTHEKFLPGLGFYGWGYLHVIGGLGKAATGALRLLLDGSATSSLQGGFKSRDARIAGDMEFTPGTWVDVDMTAEELAKSFYTPPFKEPSPALFKTLELLVVNVQRLVGTTEARVGDAPATGPVGTMVALIEQASKIFSGIHKRLHAAKRREFKLIAKCNYRFMSEEEFKFISSKGSLIVYREDFSDEVDVIPVSDPNIFSSVQRIALAQAVVQAATEAPDVFNARAKKKAYRNLLKALKVPSVDEYLPENSDPLLDPVSENEAIARGIPTQVHRENDDPSHLAVHVPFLQELQGYPPDVAQPAMLAMQAHIAWHNAQNYRKRVEAELIARTGVPLPPFDPQNPGGGQQLTPEIEVAVSKLVARMQSINPPPMQTAPNDPEAAKDQAAAREQDRKDKAFEREEKRKDQKQQLELRRDGFISDVPDENMGPVSQF
jgi:chaperonin GroES